jgi:prepilin-type N-terminal cleavage/methylation domain-containing protein
MATVIHAVLPSATARRANFARPPFSAVASSVPAFWQRGFTLIELAIVMFIVALLLGGMLMPLSAQQDVRARTNTEKLLLEAKETLLGFAALNERLPCPATANSSGREAFCSTADYPCSGSEEYVYEDAAPPGNNAGVCFDYYGGFLPAVTLGIQPTDGFGYAIDYWGNYPSNRVRYAVSTNSLRTDLTASPPITPTALALTRSEGMKSAVIKPDLSVCSSGAQVFNPGAIAVGPNNYAKCAVGASLVDDAVAVIYSVGKNAGSGGTGTDETHNPNPQATVTADSAFVSMTPTPDFDDMLIWISPSILVGRMVSAGKL